MRGGGGGGGGGFRSPVVVVSDYMSEKTGENGHAEWEQRRGYSQQKSLAERILVKRRELLVGGMK